MGRTRSDARGERRCRADGRRGAARRVRVDPGRVDRPGGATPRPPRPRPRPPPASGWTPAVEATTTPTPSETPSPTPSTEPPRRRRPSTATPTPSATPTTKPDPDTEPPPPKPRTSLVRGDSGPKVLALQQRLKELGYWLGAPDGSFGSLTQQAVWAFQKSAGLRRDGVVGPKTLEGARGRHPAEGHDRRQRGRDRPRPADPARRARRVGAHRS